MPLRSSALLGPTIALALAAGCHAGHDDRNEGPSAPSAPSAPPASEPMSSDFDPSAWNGRCVVAQGYAQDQKIGPTLDLGGPHLDVVFDDDGDWPVPLGARVRVKGMVAERADLPVFVPDPNEPIVQGIPVEPGTDLEQARRRWVIEHPEVTLVRTIAEVEAELMGKVGETVELAGVLWSRNGKWWFVHDGVDVHLERAGELVFEDHGKAMVVKGKLLRKKVPRVGELGIRDAPEMGEGFVVRVEEFGEHPLWGLEGC